MSSAPHGPSSATSCHCLRHLPRTGVRLLRASKNRYGHGGALGVFSMDSGGLAAVPNPSALFLADSTSGNRAASGITVVLEGNRPLVVEAQVAGPLLHLMLNAPTCSSVACSSQLAARSSQLAARSLLMQ